MWIGRILTSSPSGTKIAGNIFRIRKQIRVRPNLSKRNNQMITRVTRPKIQPDQRLSRCGQRPQKTTRTHKSTCRPSRIGRETKATENTNPQTRVPQRWVRGRADLGALGGGRTRRRPVGHAGGGVPEGATGDGVAVDARVGNGRERARGVQDLRSVRNRVAVGGPGRKCRCRLVFRRFFPRPESDRDSAAS